MRPTEVSRPASAAPRTAPSPRSGRQRPGHPRVPNAGSREARQRAAVILDVLAGVCTPTGAAQMLGTSITRYYVLEARLLAALVTACEDRPRGRARGPEQEIAALKREVERLKQECARKQSLVRAVQRTMGLTLPEPHVASAKGGRRRRRRPVVRALRAAAALRTPPVDEGEPPAAA
jgi:hypothetical protein